MTTDEEQTDSLWRGIERAPFVFTVMRTDDHDVKALAVSTDTEDKMVRLTEWTKDIPDRAPLLPWIGRLLRFVRVRQQTPFAGDRDRWTPTAKRLPAHMKPVLAGGLRADANARGERTWRAVARCEHTEGEAPLWHGQGIEGPVLAWTELPVFPHDFTQSEVSDGDEV